MSTSQAASPAGESFNAKARVCGPGAVDRHVHDGAVGLVRRPVRQALAVGFAEDLLAVGVRWRLTERHRQMQPAQVPPLVGSGQLGGDDRAPVAAARPVALVAEALHQLGEG